jgi:hypothetical protein
MVRCCATRLANPGVLRAHARPKPQLCLLLLFLLLFIIAVPNTKLFAWGRGIVEDVFFARRRSEDCVE